MPWEEKTTMSNRKEFIVKAIAKEISFSQLCREYNITRKTGYKWLNRYLNGESLEDKSKAPFHSPNRTPEAMEQLILSFRESHPAWGPRKMHKVLENKGHENLPATSTIAAILKRNDMIPIEESLKHIPYKRFEYEKPNQLWQLDFKGDFFMLNKQRCYPLTVLDDHSRYSLAVDAKGNQKSDGVFETFNRIFKEYGLPNAILCDNGIPWKDNRNGYTPFEILLMRLNILPIHGRVYHPQTQGKEERFHRTMKAELLKYTAMKDLTHAQQCFDIWRQEYNHERPHDALNLEVPAKRYEESKIPFPDIIKDPDYDTGARLRKVNCKGFISIKNHRYYLSESFIGQFIRLLQDEDEHLIKLCYGNFEIAKIDLKEQTFITKKIYRLKQ